MSVCQVRQLKIGEGKPKVCIPVVETTTSSILKQIQFLQSYLFDIIELRIDFYQDIHDLQKVQDLLMQIRNQTEKPLLLTYRSAREGGQIQLSDEAYLALVKTACQSQ